MGITGSDDYEWLPGQIDERLETGRWPKEAQELQRRRDRYKMLLELCNEAGDQVHQYETALGRKLRIPPCPPATRFGGASAGRHRGASKRRVSPERRMSRPSARRQSGK